MNEVLVSVVVPIYKVEKYLHQCVDSIIAQTYSNLEIILVDDGSPDQCPGICDEYATLDSRIKVIHKANGGLSDARNAGTALASGEYIIYIDSDDWVRKDYVEKLVKMAIEQHAEMVICGSQNVSTRKDPTTAVSEYNKSTFTQKEALETLLYQHGMDTSAWGRIVKTEIAKKHLFPKGLLFEDLATIYKYILECDKIACINEPMYFYYQNPTSITHTKGDPKKLDIIPIVNQLADDVTNAYPELEVAAMARKFSVYCYVMMQLNLLGGDYKELEQQVWNFICSYRRKMIFDKKARTKNRCAAVLTYAGRKIFKRMK